MTQIPAHFICPTTQQIYRVPVYQYINNQKVYFEFEELRENTSQLDKFDAIYYDRKLKQEIDVFFKKNPRLAVSQTRSSTLSTPDDFDLDTFINADEETFKQQFTKLLPLKKYFRYAFIPSSRPSNKPYRDLFMQRKVVIDCIATMANQNPDDPLLQKKLDFLKHELKRKSRKAVEIGAPSLIVGLTICVTIIALTTALIITMPPLALGLHTAAFAMAVMGMITASCSGSLLLAATGGFIASISNSIYNSHKNALKTLKNEIPPHMLEAYSFKKVSTTSDEFSEVPTLHTYQYDGIEQPQMKNSGSPNVEFNFSKLNKRFN